MKLLNYKKYLLSAILVLGLLLSMANVKAQGLKDTFNESYLGDAAKKMGYETNPAKNSLLDIISMIITTLLSLLGVIFLILLIYGGFLWMTARGNEQQVDKAKDTIFSAIIGLFIVIAAYSISYFVVYYMSEGVIEN